MNNLRTVQDIYVAFRRGDIPAILSKLADDVDWEYGAGPTEIPWLQHRSGPAGAAAFLQSLAAMEVHSFVPKVLTEGDNTVIVALVDVEFTVKATGKYVKEEDEVHIWRFNREGKVARFRHRVDTLQQAFACRAD